MGKAITKQKRGNRLHNPNLVVKREDCLQVTVDITHHALFHFRGDNKRHHNQQQRKT